MNDLLTQLNGGSVPTLEIIFLLTFAALLPSFPQNRLCLMFENLSSHNRLHSLPDILIFTGYIFTTLSDISMIIFLVYALI